MNWTYGLDDKTLKQYLGGDYGELNKQEAADELERRRSIKENEPELITYCRQYCDVMATMEQADLPSVFYDIWHAMADGLNVHDRMIDARPQKNRY